MTLYISVWSDVACPWCYVGKRRLETALKTVARGKYASTEIKIEWKSFELDPRKDHDYGDEVYMHRLAKKYGTSEAQAQDMIDRMSKTGAEEGLAFDFETAIAANTFDAHRLLQLAKVLDEKGKTKGMQGEMKELFLRAHFEEGADIASHETLVRLAGEAGLDVDKASAVLASDDFSQEVRDDIEEAQMLSITGVPFFAIGRFAVQGAQQANTLADLIEKSIKEENTDVLAEDEISDDLCLPDGC